MRRTASIAVAALAAAGGTWASAGDTGDRGRVARGTAPVADAARAARVELGRRLFFDPAASRTGLHSCVSCHDPEHGFTDRAHPSKDEFGPARRRSMPVTDLSGGAMHSDGEFPGVRELLTARLQSFDDLAGDRRTAALRAFGGQLNAYGNLVGAKPALVNVAERVAMDRLYDAAFIAAYGDAMPTLDRVMESIEAYTGELRTGTNAFDRHLAGDDDALPPDAQRGLALFVGKAGCATCHVVAPESGRAPLRDGKFHDTGIAWRTAVARGSNDPKNEADQGLGAQGPRAADRRRESLRFKTPSLRDIVRRGPYMHDGSLATLLDVIDFYDRGGTPHPGLDPAIHPLALTAADKDDLLAFLIALSAPARAGLAPPPAWLARATTVRIVSPDGRPLAGAAVEIQPAGDAFLGVDVPAGATHVLTDKLGRATFPFPRSTHARLLVDGHGVAGGRLLPDVAAGAELIAVPAGQAALRVLTDGSGLPLQVRAVPTQMTDALGRTTAPREGESLEFAFVRRLSAGEGLYVARLPKGAPGSARRILVPRGDHGAAGLAQIDVDLTGGAITFVDMRPGPNAGAVPPLPGTR